MGQPTATSAPIREKGRVLHNAYKYSRSENSAPRHLATISDVSLRKLISHFYGRNPYKSRFNMWRLRTLYMSVCVRARVFYDILRYINPTYVC